MTHGRFITFEGGEGAGKSTQVTRLAAALDGAGIRAVTTREPGGSPGAEQVRELLIHGDSGRWDAMSEALLLSAARRDHVIRTIVPALEAGHWVLCDRFADSTLAYQGYGHGLDHAAIEQLYRLAAGDLTADMTVILDLPIEQGLARSGARGTGGERFERLDPAFHERLRQGFLAIAARAPARCAVIDARGTVEQVHLAVRQAVDRRLGTRLA